MILSQTTIVCMERKEKMKKHIDVIRYIDGKEYVELRHGKWEYDAETAGFKCTACGKRIYGMTLEIGSGDIKYCPNCGARMEEVEE